jgi:hypothetical protein
MLGREKRRNGHSSTAKMIGVAGLSASLGGLIGRRSAKLTKTVKKKAKKARKKLRKAEPVPH